MSDCPPVEMLEELARQSLPGELAIPVQEHLSSCAACRQQYDECVANCRFSAELRNALAGGRVILPEQSYQAGDQPEITGYELIREIHRGAQGVVYEALQCSTRRRVAVKVIIGGPFADVTARRRFEREVELAARLRHPNIVTIHDSGEAGGCHYFVMDFVEGVRLDEHLRRQRPPLQDTLRLFINLCAAVNYAHQRGVIHRDLKPSNVLVDSEGQPRVLDFGLAKPLCGTGDAGDHSILSSPGQVLGTLQYMSPEQARGAVQDVDVRSDVYALGVMLYQALTGRLPSDASGPLAEVLWRIIEVEPVRPSMLNRQLGSELETIVLKALAKEPHRRYQSTGALGEDLQRYLAGDTIEAKRESRLYVLRKTVRRYRAPLAVAAAFVLVLIAALVISVQARLAAEQQRRAAAEHAERLRRVVYANQIALAQAACEGGQIARMKKLLYTCPADLRGWEWYYLVRQSDQSVTTLRGHTRRVLTVAIDQRSGRIFSIDGDGVLRTWASKGGEASPSVDLGRQELWCAEIQAEAGRVACGWLDGTLEVRETAHGAVLGSWHMSEGKISALALTTDGRLVLAACPGGSVQLFDVGTGSEVCRFTAHDSDVVAVAIAPGNQRYASLDHAGRLRLWKMPDGLVWERRLPIIDGRLAWGHDGSSVACGGGADAGITIFEADTGSERFPRMPGHQRDVRCVAFTPDDRHVLSGGQDGTLSIWDAHTGENVGTLRGHEYPVLGLATTVAAEPVIATAGEDATVKLWAFQTQPNPRALNTGPARATALAFDPSGQRLATGNGAGELVTWDLETGSCAAGAKGDNGITSLAWSPTGEYILSGDGAGSVCVRDAAALRVIQVLGQYRGRVHRVVFSPDGRPAALCGSERTVRLWDKDGKTVVREWSHPSNVHGLAFEPDGGRVVVGCEDGFLYVWDVQTGQLVHSFAAHHTMPGNEAKPVDTVAFRPDGLQIASGGQDNCLRVWEALRFDELASTGAHAYDVLAVAYSPDGKRLATGSYDGTVRIWDAATAEEVLTLRGFRADTPGLQFNNPMSLLAASNDDVTWVFAAATPEQVSHDPEAAFQFGRAALALCGRGQAGEAEVLFEEAAGIYQRAIAAEPERARDITLGLVDLYEKWGKPDKAARWRPGLEDTVWSGTSRP